MKKMLMVAAVPSMIGQFNMENIGLLFEMGYKVHVACNFNDTSVWTEERTKEFIYRLKELKVSCHQIEFSRAPGDIKSLVQSYRQTDRLVKKEGFRFVHCHTPVAAGMQDGLPKEPCESNLHCPWVPFLQRRTVNKLAFVLPGGMALLAMDGCVNNH